MTDVNQIMNLSMSEYKALVRASEYRKIDDLVRYVDQSMLQRVIVMAEKKPDQNAVNQILRIDERHRDIDELFDSKKQAEKQAKQAAMIESYLRVTGGGQDSK
jgi:hypothetical protein